MLIVPACGGGPVGRSDWDPSGFPARERPEAATRDVEERTAVPSSRSRRRSRAGRRRSAQLAKPPARPSVKTSQSSPFASTLSAAAILGNDDAATPNTKIRKTPPGDAPAISVSSIVLVGTTGLDCPLSHAGATDWCTDFDVEVEPLRIVGHAADHVGARLRERCRRAEMPDRLTVRIWSHTVDVSLPPQFCCAWQFVSWIVNVMYRIPHDRQLGRVAHLVGGFLLAPAGVARSRFRTRSRRTVRLSPVTAGLT